MSESKCPMLETKRSTVEYGLQSLQSLEASVYPILGRSVTTTTTESNLCTPESLWIQFADKTSDGLKVNGINSEHVSERFRYMQHARYNLNDMYGGLAAILLILKCVQACMDVT